MTANSSAALAQRLHSLYFTSGTDLFEEHLRAHFLFLFVAHLSYGKL